MMKANYRLPFLLLFLLVGGCGEGNNETGRQAQVYAENPLKAQVDAIKQARELEQLVQAHSEKRHQMMEEQIR